MFRIFSLLVHYKTNLYAYYTFLLIQEVAYCFEHEWVDNKNGNFVIQSFWKSLILSAQFLIMSFDLLKCIQCFKFQKFTFGGSKDNSLRVGKTGWIGPSKDTLPHARIGKGALTVLRRVRCSYYNAEWPQGVNSLNKNE